MSTSRLARRHRAIRGRDRVSRLSRRDFEATCSVRFFIGSGIPGQPGRYRGLPAAFDSETFTRAVERLVGRAFPGATYTRARGVWKGQGEDTLIVEVTAAPVRRSCNSIFRRAERIAEVIARELGQEAVLVIAEDHEGRQSRGFVSARAA